MSRPRTSEKLHDIARLQKPKVCSRGRLESHSTFPSMKPRNGLLGLVFEKVPSRGVQATAALARKALERMNNIYGLC